MPCGREQEYGTLSTLVYDRQERAVEFKKRLKFAEPGETQRASTTLLSVQDRAIPNLIPDSDTHHDTPTRATIPISSGQPFLEVTVKGDVPDTFRLLLDTGASDNYIDHRAALNFSQLSQQYKNPINIRLFDGTPSSSGPITQFLELPLRISSDLAPIDTHLHVTKLEGADIVLGSSWMATHKVSINLFDRVASLQGNEPASSPTVTHESPTAAQASFVSPFVVYPLVESNMSPREVVLQALPSFVNHRVQTRSTDPCRLASQLARPQ